MKDVAQFTLKLINKLEDKLTRSQLLLVQYLIMFGEFELSQAELAESLKISRRSVNISLRGLAKLGIIEVVPYHRTRKGLIKFTKEFSNVG